MANASAVRAGAADTRSTKQHLTRPALPHRSLSSSLRMYSSPLVPRVQNRSKTAPYSTEIDPLLGFAPRDHRLSVTSFRTSSVGTGFDGADDDIDIEAEQTDEQADSDGLYPPNCCWTTDGNLPKRSDPFGNQDCDVYGNIHRIRRDIMDRIDDPYSLEQLKSPRMNVSVVRPLVEKYYNKQDLSMVYCLLVNRAQFLRQQSAVAHHQTVNLTRALLCEILAEKVLRRYNELHPGPRGLLKIANILVFAFEPFQGAPKEIVQEADRSATRESYRQISAQHKHLRHHHRLTALEVAIVGESKSFLASTACKKVVDAIYRGKVVYSPSSFIDILPDRYKRRPISLYDPRRAPVLNQYRLVVPRTRAWIEIVQFTILLGLYIWVMTGRESRQKPDYTVIEAIFNLYTMGWILDQLTSILEHGWHVYTQNLWSFLDVTFSALFLTYFGMRMRGLATANDGKSEVWALRALDVLSCAAPVLIPRLAFNVMSENMLFLSLRAMMGDFVTLTILAFWCFAGFLLSLKWLHSGLHNVTEISKWMIFVWFGLDGTGLNEAPSFHPILGPILFVAFAFLGNTLFLTILVSMLSNTFSLIASNAIQEISYRRAVLTFLGVKSDALFAFAPPFNLAALFVLAPLKWILSPRTFHSVNVFIVRVINLPFLMLLSWYERKTLWVSNRNRRIQPKNIDWAHQGGPRVVRGDWWAQNFRFWDMTRFSAHGDIQAVFESEPPASLFWDGREQSPGFQGHRSSSQKDFKNLRSMGTVAEQSPGRRSTHFSAPFASSPPSIPRIIADDKHDHTSSPSSIRKFRFRNPSHPNETADGTLSPTSSTAQKRHHRLRFKRSSSYAATATDPLRRQQTFPDSEDDDDDNSQQRAGHPKDQADKLKRRISRARRKDSMIDYEDAGVAGAVANARLSKLEKRLGRIEELLVRAITAAEGGEGEADEEEEAELALEEDVAVAAAAVVAEEAGPTALDVETDNEIHMDEVRERGRDSLLGSL